MPIEDLLKIMARLRDPQGGCPWDLKQDFDTIAPYTIEEAYEVHDAIRRQDYNELKDELGDLLLQVVFHSRIAEEAELFDFDDVCDAICKKMISRHPHVFGDKRASSSEDVINRIWEEKKHEERKNKDQTSTMDGVALALPALMRAQKLQKRAARKGFDWPSAEGVMDKLSEELEELASAMNSGNGREIREEFGDVLFTIVNAGRKLGIDCEESLRESSYKFESRFNGMEKEINAEYEENSNISLDQMEELWVAEKNKNR